TNLTRYLLQTHGLRLAMLLDSHNHDGFGIEFQRLAVRTAFQQVRTEGLLNHLPIGRDARSTAFAPEGLAGTHLQTQLMRRLLKIRSFERKIFQFPGRLDKTLLDLFRLQITLQLVLENSKAGNI